MLKTSPVTGKIVAVTGKTIQIIVPNKPGGGMIAVNPGAVAEEAKALVGKMATVETESALGKGLKCAMTATKVTPEAEEEAPTEAAAADQKDDSA
jgi:hypothetical protein